MKHIAFFINSLAGGGAERILSTMLYELKDSFKITLILIENDISYEIPQDIQIIYLYDKKINSSILKFIHIGLLSYKFAKITNNINADISFSLTTRPNLINGLSKKFGKKSKSIIYEVATPSVMYNKKNIHHKIIKKLISYIYPLNDKILTNSKGVASDLKENFNIQKEIKSIYSPIDIDFIIQSSKKENYDKSLFDNNFTKYITIGRLDYGKNHEMMIKAFSKINNKNSILYILGNGELEEKLKNLVQSLDLEKKVLFLGFDNNPFKYLSKCDIFLFTSRFEGFPTVLIEALACGLPIISTDCKSGPREILSNINNFKESKKDVDICEYGILSFVDNKKLFIKAINLLEEDKLLFQELKNKTIKRAYDFSKEKSIKEIKKILN